MFRRILVLVVLAVVLFILANTIAHVAPDVNIFQVLVIDSETSLSAVSQLL